MSFFQVHNRRVKFSSNGPDHLKEGAKGQAEFWCVQKSAWDSGSRSWMLAFLPQDSAAMD